MKPSRRELIGVVGAVVGSALLGSMVGERDANASQSRPAKPLYPWPYHILDPIAVAERAYAAHMDGYCMFGAFEGIIGELSHLKGKPYSDFPTKMMIIGGTGGCDWGTLCGALNGSMLAIALLTKEPKPLVDELFRWYETTALPDYRPTEGEYDIPKSVAKSPLCHLSVTRWCNVSKKKSYSPERNERCGWLTSSVAKKTVELLNMQAEGKFIAAFPTPEKVKKCRTCHDKGGKRENTRVRMTCDTCHPSIGPEHPGE